MLSVELVNGKNKIVNNKVSTKNRAIQIPVSKTNPMLLTNFMSALSATNRAQVSFTGDIRPAYTDAHINLNEPSETISKRTRDEIWTESSRRIEGSHEWPKIKDVNAWMISAETQKFMATGGLAQVAEDLPMAFNAHSPNKKDKMSVVTPLYTKPGLELTKVKGKKDTFNYKGFELKKLGQINVGMYDEWQGGKERQVPVNILKGKVPDNKGVLTDYIFLQNDEVFSIDPAQDNNPDCKECYAKNKNGYDEVSRFAFASKAVYQLMKDSKEGNVGGLKAPNVAVLNDWHFGPLAAAMRYTTKADCDTGKVSKEMNDYMNSVPTVYITHNLGYKGATWDNQKTQKALGTVLGDNAKDILNASCGWRDYQDNDPNKNALFDNNGFCSAKIGMSLADRIVPVSENYGEELKTSDDSNFGNGLGYLLRSRDYHKTFTPITNGYSKSKIVPSQANLDNDMKFNAKCLTNVPEGIKSVKTDDIKLKSFEDGNLDNKFENKKQLMKLYQRIIDREQEIQSKDASKLTEAEKNREKERRVVVYDAKNTDINIPENKMAEVPVMVTAGRIVSQKGFHNVLGPALIQVAEKLKNSDKEAPVVIIGGGPYEQGCLNSLKETKDKIMKINPEFGKRIMLIQGFAHTNTIADMGDFFFVPSNYEPCGLTQLEAMAKGALPITSSTGGLVNTVQDGVDGFRTKVFYDSDGNNRKMIYKADGVDATKAPKYNNEAYADTIMEALDTFYEQPEKINEMKKTALSRDFSWEVKGGSLEKYRALFLTGDINGKVEEPKKRAAVAPSTPIKIDGVPTMTEKVSYIAGQKLSDEEAKKVMGEPTNKELYGRILNKINTNYDRVTYQKRSLNDIKMILGDTKASNEKLAGMISNLVDLG